MDEHMIAAEIAAMKSEIETLKRQQRTVRAIRINPFEAQCTGCTHYAPKWARYCPNCGAKFEEVTDAR